MKLTNERLYPETNQEDTFVARNDRGRLMGVCTVNKRKVATLFPDDPVQYEIRAEGNPAAYAALYGAAVARVRMIRQLRNEPVRVYAAVNTDDEESLQVLNALGFRNTDSVIRLVRDVTDEPNHLLPPPHCTIVRDFLNDPHERKYFLERHNALYGLHHGEKWLNEVVSKPDFVRILMISTEDLCGEVMVWTEEGEGVIGMLHTARRWRRKGVAGYLLEDARLYLNKIGIDSVHMDVWQRLPGAMQLAGMAGYMQTEPVLLYPEMDLK